MKKALLTLAFIGSANAQELNNYKLEILCGSTEVFQKIIIKHEEELHWSKIQPSGIIVSLWYNKNTKSFTILQTSKTGEVSCVLVSGNPAH